MTSVEIVERFANSDGKFCGHGLNDNMTLKGSSTIDGTYYKIKRHYYECHEHGRFGSFAVEEKKKPVVV